MRYIEGEQRNQAILFPESIDEYIEENNLVRFVEAFVDSLDMKELNFTYCEPKETGRKAYNPGSMLKLYIYGYINRIRSSRKLEIETQRNVELMWLMKKLSPDFKTIADFRKDNIDSIKKVCREFTIFCKRLDLYGGELVAIDGSKFKAVNSKDRCFTKNNLKREIKEIDKNIDRYLKEIERVDKKEYKFKKVKKEELEQIIKDIGEKRKELSGMLQEIESGKRSQISLTDPESRMMKTSGKNFQVSYNGQISVDTKHHMIIESEITNQENDLNQLSNIAENTKQELGLEEIKVVCDTGYFNEKGIAKCENEGIECYIAAPEKHSNADEGMYGLEEFKYNKEKDVYICPEKKELTYASTYKKGEKELRKYECRECKICQNKTKCTKSKGNRYITRSEFSEVVEKVKERMKENRGFMQKRKETVEHVFGTMKQWLGYGGGFLLKGIKKVNCELKLIALSYNIKRAINIIGIKGLLKALETA